MNVFFIYPRFLYLLLIIPVLILLYFLSSSYGKKKAFLFSNFEALERISGIEFFSKSFIVLFLDLLFVIFLIFSLAGLQISYEARTDSFNHIILLDNSRSMGVEDIGISRLQAGKDVSKSFIDFMPSGVEFGVVAFAGDAQVVKRMDSSALRTKSAIDTISTSPVEGTRLFNAVLLADSLFSGGRKSILLISDGEFTSSNLSNVLEFAEEQDIVINSIVVGTQQGGRDEFGGLHRVDVEIMRALAFNTGGQFFEINSAEIPANFQEVFVETNREIRRDLTFYLILGALLLFILSWLINNFRIRTFV